jgi:hypothetical protein
MGENAGRQLKALEKKWSKELVASGWTAIPTVIVEHQRELGLDALDVNILVQLSSLWWSAEMRPHPSKRHLAEAIGVDPRTIQRRVAALEAKQLLRREERRDNLEGSKSNIYHFDGLIAAAKQLSGEVPKREAPAAAAPARGIHACERAKAARNDSKRAA